MHDDNVRVKQNDSSLDLFLKSISNLPPGQLFNILNGLIIYKLNWSLPNRSSCAVVDIISLQNGNSQSELRVLN